MKITKTVSAFAILLVVLSAARARAAGDVGSAEEARAAIEAANAKFSEAFARGDTPALAVMYTTDAIVFPPDSEMVRGRVAIGEFWKGARDNGVQSATLTTIDVGRSGDVAYETGKVTLKVQPAGKEATTVVEKYLVVWKRQPDGSWQLHRDIWNNLPPAK
jgi:uncharacterized protein (TIGR02246 family)